MGEVEEVIKKILKDELAKSRPDSVEVKASTKRAGFKVYLNIDNPTETLTRIENAKKAAEEADKFTALQNGA